MYQSDNTCLWTVIYHLNYPVMRHRLADWIRKQDSFFFCCLQEMYVCLCVWCMCVCASVWAPSEARKGHWMPHSQHYRQLWASQSGGYALNPSLGKTSKSVISGFRSQTPTQQNGVEPDWRTCMHVHHIRHPCILTPIKQNLHISVTPSAPWGRRFQSWITGAQHWRATAVRKDRAGQ